MTETKFPKLGTKPVELTEDHILSVLIVRRARDDAIGKDLFSDPAWDILLELFAARLGSRSITTRDLATAIGTPLSTTVRWIRALQDQRLVESVSARTGGGSIVLSAEGLKRMRRLGSRWASAFLAIA